MHRASPSLFKLSPVSRAVFCLASVAALGIFGTQAAYAQDVPAAPSPALAAPAADPSWSLGATEDQPLILKMTPMLAEKPPEGEANKPPSFVFGDNISGRPDLETVIEGNAEVRQGVNAIKADRIEFYQPDDTVNARGNVHVSNSGNQFRGPELRLKLDTFEGYFNEPSYRFIANGGNGTASRIDFISDKQMVARNA
ncbi:MAG: Organic solvent tolerance protein, partial [Polaromonas sp.]|nr:Organic solvent tolerance protein [Polaromonas sp.]